MAPDKTAEILRHIEEAVGKPEDETPEERSARIERRIRRKELRAPS